MTPTCTHPLIDFMQGSPCAALLVALDAWIANGTLPPASRYPSRADGRCRAQRGSGRILRGIPGVTYPARINQAAVVDDKVMPPVRGAATPASKYRR